MFNVRDLSVTSSALEVKSPQAFSFSLFDSFIKYIDRGDRTARTYLCNLRQFASWLSYSQIRKPQREDVISFRDWLLSEHEAIIYSKDPRGWEYRKDQRGRILRISCKPATVRLYLQSVKQLFSWTEACGLYPNIAKQIHSPKIRRDQFKKEAFSADQVLKIEETIEKRASARTEKQAQERKDTEGRIQRSTEQGKRLYAMYLLAVNAGLRTVEISRANIKDLEIIGGQAYLFIWGKGHAEPDQKKALASGVYEAIKDYLKSRTDFYNGSSPLFVSTGNRSAGKRIATTTISTMLKKAMIEAGYNSERYTAHSLRHTAGSCVMKISNGNLYTAQAYMRHADPATTEIYLHNNEETQRAEANLARDLFEYYHAKREDSWEAF